MAEGTPIDDDAARVYLGMLADSTQGVAELSGRLGIEPERIRQILDELADRSLLRLGEHTTYAPVAPRLALSGLVADAERQLHESRQRVQGLRALVDSACAEYESRLSRESLVHLTDIATVRDRLDELSSTARFECLSLTPGRAVTPETIESSRETNAAALARGMQIRLIYQASCRNDPTTLAYVRWLAERGGEVRTRPALPMMLVVVDREVAFVPRVVDDPAAGALEVRDPSLVAALVDWFTGLWQGAEPLGDARRAPEITAQTRRELLRLMASGLTDEAAGRRLGLSGRTVRRSMADLMAELGAASRFQAGVAAQRRGWLDADAAAPSSLASR